MAQGRKGNPDDNDERPAGAYKSWEDVPARIREPIDRRIAEYRPVPTRTDSSVDWKALKSNSALGRLDLRYCSIDPDVFAPLLAEWLTRLPRLLVLELDGNALGDDGLRLFAARATEFPALQSLVLRNNQITGAGMADLAPLFAKLTALHFLGLDANQITDAGMADLAPCLAKLSGLQSLWLEHNRITGAGIDEFVRCLANRTTLKTLVLEDNQITDASIAKLVPGLERLTALEWLSLSDNHITGVGMAKLVPCLAKLTALRCLSLSENRITDAAAIVTVLESLCPGGKLGGKLKTVYVQHNPLAFTSAAGSTIQVPPEVLGIDDPRKLLAELKRYQSPDAKTERLLWLRATILGRQEIGKSHAWVRLNNGGELHKDERGKPIPPDKTADWDASLLPLDRAGPDQETVQLIFFDLGGDPEMHGCHRTFLRNERNLYLVMCNASIPLDKSMLDYWMRVVNAYGRYRHPIKPDEYRQAPAIVILSFFDEGVDPTFDKTRFDEDKVAGDHGVPTRLIRDYWEPIGKPSRDVHGAIIPNPKRSRPTLDHSKKLAEIEAAIRERVKGLHDEISIEYQAGYGVAIEQFTWKANPDPNAPVRKTPLCDGPIALQQVKDLFFAATKHKLDKTSDVGPRLLSNLGLILCPELDVEMERAHADDERARLRPPLSDEDVLEQVGDLVFGVRWLKKLMYGVVRNATFVNKRGLTDKAELLRVLNSELNGDAELARKTLALLRIERLVFEYRSRGEMKFLVVDRLEKEDDTRRKEQEEKFVNASRWTMPLKMVLESHLPQFIGLAFAKLDDAAAMESNVCRDAVKIVWRDDPSVTARLTVDLNAPAIHLAILGGTPSQQDSFSGQLKLMLREVLGDEKVEWIGEDEPIVAASPYIASENGGTDPTGKDAAHELTEYEIAHAYIERNKNQKGMLTAVALAEHLTSKGFKVSPQVLSRGFRTPGSKWAPVGDKLGGAISKLDKRRTKGENISNPDDRSNKGFASE